MCLMMFVNSKIALKKPISLEFWQLNSAIYFFKLYCSAFVGLNRLKSTQIYFLQAGHRLLSLLRTQSSIHFEQ